MKKFEYNSYEILIDDFETSKRFNETEMIENQEYRNFAKYVDENMTDAERQFFSSLCIEPEKLNIDYAYYSETDKWHSMVKTSIIGEFISYPQTAFKTIEDVMENGLEVLENVEANDITVGHFKIHIFTPDECDWVSDDNKNAISIDVFIRGLPWLLNEKCNHKAPKPPSKFIRYLGIHFPELAIFLKKTRILIPHIISNFRERKKLNISLANELEALKDRFGIDCTVLNNKEMSEYKKLWVKSFLPVGTDGELQKKAYDLCVENKKCSTFLWHIFSFGIIESEENPTEKFDSINKKNCTLLFETGLKDIAINMSNAERIKERDIVKLCENVTGWSDFVITANDFSWTYSRTHEDGWCGPYFYKKEL